MVICWICQVAGCSDDSSAIIRTALKRALLSPPTKQIVHSMAYSRLCELYTVAYSIYSPE